MGLRALAAVCGVLFGCAVGCASGAKWVRVDNVTNSNTIYYVCVDGNLPGVDDAVRNWHYALEGWVDLRAIDSKLTTNCRIVISEEPDTGKHARAYTNDIGGGVIKLIKGMYEHNASAIVQHEIGHALGAQHVDAGLMSISVDALRDACPDRATVAQVAAWNRIEIARLKWCLR